MTTSNTELAAQARVLAKSHAAIAEVLRETPLTPISRRRSELSEQTARALCRLADAVESKAEPVEQTWRDTAAGARFVQAHGFAAPVQPEKDERKPITAKQVLAAAACHERGRVVIASVQRVLRIGYREADELCRSIVDAGLVEGLEISPALQTSHGIGSSTEGGGT